MGGAALLNFQQEATTGGDRARCPPRTTSENEGMAATGLTRPPPVPGRWIAPLDQAELATLTAVTTIVWAAISDMPSPSASATARPIWCWAESFPNRR